MRRNLQLMLIGVLCLFAIAAVAAPVIRSISTRTTTTATAIDGTSKTYPLTVTVIPESGVLATAEYSTTPNAYLSPADAHWNVLNSASAVSTVMSTTLPSPVTAIRFTRVSGASAVIGEVNWMEAP